MKKSLQSVLQLVGLLVLTSACSTVRIRVPVMRPAEVNLRGKSEIIVGEFTGPQANAIESRVKEAIAASKYLTLLSRTQQDKVMTELALKQSDLADPNAQKKVGKLLTGSILLTGVVDTNQAIENPWQESAQCQVGSGNNKQYIPCTHHHRRVTATVGFGFDLIDIQTGMNIKPKRLECQRMAETHFTDTNPVNNNSIVGLVRAIKGTEGPNRAPPIDGTHMLADCHDEVAARLMQTIAPWQDHVIALFRKDGKLPQLEMGIEYAKIGDWNSAIARFSEAQKMADNTPGLNQNTIGKAYWDLGMAYLYTSRFDEAVKAMQHAYEVTHDAEYLRELGTVEQMKQEREKLLEQTGEPAVPRS